jgi:hypothetical protein
VERWADDDGMAELRAVLTAEQAGLVWAELTTRARAEDARLRAGGSTAHPHAAVGSGASSAAPCTASSTGSCTASSTGSCTASGTGSCGGSPGLDALRADALVAAVLAPGGCGASPGESGAVTAEAPGGPAAARVQVQVTVDLATLLGLAERPGELRGHGPITPAVARALAADAEWVRWVTDPLTGQLLDLGRRRYRPSRPLERFLQAAHQVCGWPGCHYPADRCDADHVVPFASGGETTRANLGPLCRQHHNAKTHGKWRLARAPDGTGHWTSPLGASYSAPPTRHPPDG